MEDVDALVELAEDIGEERVRRVLLQAKAHKAIADFDRAMAVRFALHLWHQRAGRRAIVERLQQRYAFKERTAYNIANEGLQRFAKGRGEVAKNGSTFEAVSSPTTDPYDA